MVAHRLTALQKQFFHHGVTANLQKQK